MDRETYIKAMTLLDSIKSGLDTAFGELDLIEAKKNFGEDSEQYRKLAQEYEDARNAYEKAGRKLRKLDLK